MNIILENTSISTQMDLKLLNIIASQVDFSSDREDIYGLPTMSSIFLYGEDLLPYLKDRKDVDPEEKFRMHGDLNYLIYKYPIAREIPKITLIYEELPDDFVDDLEERKVSYELTIKPMASQFHLRDIVLGVGRIVEKYRGKERSEDDLRKIKWTKIIATEKGYQIYFTGLS